LATEREHTRTRRPAASAARATRDPMYPQPKMMRSDMFPVYILAVDKVVDGRYELLSLVGEGSHGAVYRARDQQTGNNVAVKLFYDAHRDPEYYVRMIREARSMAALAGTSAVQVHSFGSDMDGSFYIVMELLEGMNFEEQLARLESRGQRLPVSAIVPVLEPIVTTLEFAHERKIVHRDLKPSNIFLVEKGGGVRLLDFGLVKLIGAKRLTRQGIVAGSPSYIAPEAWRGNPAVLDHRIDLYALGTVVFRALAARVPFDHPDLFEKYNLVTTAPRPSLHALRPDLPPAIDDWVKRALAIEPADRFDRVRSMWTAFRHAAGV
jgi:serine/threonine-protein kinase